MKLVAIDEYHQTLNRPTHTLVKFRGTVSAFRLIRRILHKHLPAGLIEFSMNPYARMHAFHDSADFSRAEREQHWKKFCARRWLDLHETQWLFIVRIYNRDELKDDPGYQFIKDQLVLLKLSTW
jgi:hypothetical protein